jgi:hypothetical protein
MGLDDEDSLMRFVLGISAQTSSEKLKEVILDSIPIYR